MKATEPLQVKPITAEQLATCTTRGTRRKIGATNLAAMALIASRGPMNQTDLSIALGVSTAAATGAADRLSKLGFAERIRNIDPSRDRRVISLALTPLGLKALDEILGGSLSNPE